MHEWSCWNADKWHAMSPTPITFLAFLHYIYNLWFPKQIRYFVSISIPMCLPPFSDITESGNNVFLYGQSCWNAELMMYKVTRTLDLLTFLLYTYEVWFPKKFWYFIISSTPMYKSIQILTHSYLIYSLTHTDGCCCMKFKKNLKSQLTCINYYWKLRNDGFMEHCMLLYVILPLSSKLKWFKFWLIDVYSTL